MSAKYEIEREFIDYCIKLHIETSAYFVLLILSLQGICLSVWKLLPKLLIRIITVKRPTL